MPIPGTNLYNQATQLITKQPYTYYQFTGRVSDDRGRQQAAYAAGVDFSDSIQAVARELYVELGLDWQKYYVKIFTNQDIFVVERDISGDQIAFNSDRYQLLASTDWRPQDGWREIIAARLVTETSP